MLPEAKKQSAITKISFFVKSNPIVFADESMIKPSNKSDMQP